MEDSLVSEKKRTRLQALECRLVSSSFPAKKGTNPLPRSNSSLKSAALTLPIAKAELSSSTVSVRDVQDPVYAQLSKQVLDGPVASHLKVYPEKNEKTVVDLIIREIVQDSGRSVRNLENVLDSRVQDRVLLLDNPAVNGKAAEKARRRAAQSIANRSSKHLSKRQQKLIGSFDLPLQYQRFSLFEHMHELWKAYAISIVDNSSGKMIEHAMVQLDLHGAYVAVVQARIDNQVGIQGIMIRETTNTLAIVTREDKIKVIPKEGSVFVFRLKDMRVAVYGHRMLSTASSVPFNKT